MTILKKKLADRLHDEVHKANRKALQSSFRIVDNKLLPHQMFEKNPNLKKAGTKLVYSDEQVIELRRCSKDPLYFINNYCYVVNPKVGLTKFKTRDYQDELVKMMHRENRVLVKFPRQSGKTVSTAAYAVWEMIFRKASAIAILANKAKTAIGILQKVRNMYENLPCWIQIGVVEWNKSGVKLENGSEVQASATSSSAIRSMAISTLIIDECAFVPKNIWQEFYASVYPTVSSVKSSKIFLISTPFGMNHFYKFWMDAESKKSEFKSFEIEWDSVPGRDKEFKKKVVAEFGLDYWNQEFACEFLGSAGTLIPGWKLKTLVWKNPVDSRLDDHLNVYELPFRNNVDGIEVLGQYVIIFDTGEGTGNDSSTVQVFRVDEKPYDQVAVYDNNDIPIREFPYVVEKIAQLYNEALVIGENNTIGAAILDDLYYDCEYENIFTATAKTSQDELNDAKMGIRMTSRSKSLGCSNLKTNICDDHFKINDADTIDQFAAFAKKGASYQADTGKHDDLVTPLVIFSYFLRHREWVEEWMNQSKERIKSSALSKMEEDLLPIGFIVDVDGPRNMDRDDDFYNIDTDYQFF